MTYFSVISYSSFKFPFRQAPVLAILATILIFMDQQITAVIVNRKDFMLKKGGGYHLDLLVLALIITVCSIFGLPWFVAATVLSINHIQSLTKVPLIYYVSTFTTQNLICLPNFSPKTVFFFQTKEFYFSTYTLTKFSCWNWHF